MLTSHGTKTTSTGTKNSPKVTGSIESILLASTAALLAASSFNFVSASATPSPINTTASSTTSISKTTVTGSGGGGSSGGGPTLDSGVAPAVISSAKEDVRKYEDAMAKNPYQVGSDFQIFYFALSRIPPHNSQKARAILS
jgi:hypothetical protein